MKILIFSEMFPKPNSPSSGIFIIKRIEQLLASGKDIEVIFAPISVSDNLLISLIKKIYGLNPIKLPENVRIDSRSYKVIKIRMSLLDRYRMLKGDPRAWLKYAERMKEALERNFHISDFDIIHAHRVFPEGYTAMLLSEEYGKPYIVTAHGGEIHSINPKLKRYVINALEKSSKAIFVSRKLLQQARELGYSGDNAVVIPNGVDTNLFKPMDKIKIRKELGIYKENCKYIGFVGNLIPVKRADKLPEIFRQIKKLYPDVFFIVVGDGYLRKKIEEETKDLDILFTGRVKPEEVPYYMNAMDVLILPSRNEGWPCVVLEAQACGIPVVGSDVGGIPEAIGEGGVVVRDGPDFEGRFGEAVVKMLGNLLSPSYLVQKAIHYDWRVTVKKELRMYNDILNIRGEIDSEVSDRNSY